MSRLLDDEDEVRALIAPHVAATGGLIVALRALLERDRYIAGKYLPVVADAFNLSLAEVRGVVSFYADFRTTPPGRHVVRICQAEACQAVGGRALTQAVVARLGVALGATRDDGEVTLEPVYCLGLCACAPALMLNDALVGRADLADLDRLLEGVP
jgi:formate dehydrogenase subunit gamma